MAAALVDGMVLCAHFDPVLGYHFKCRDEHHLQADLNRYGRALERLLNSEEPLPAGLEAQHALFRPIDTAGG